MREINSAARTRPDGKDCVVERLLGGDDYLVRFPDGKRLAITERDLEPQDFTARASHPGAITKGAAAAPAGGKGAPKAGGKNSGKSATKPFVETDDRTDPG